MKTLRSVGWAEKGLGSAGSISTAWGVFRSSLIRKTTQLFVSLFNTRILIESRKESINEFDRI